MYVNAPSWMEMAIGILAYLILAGSIMASLGIMIHKISLHWEEDTKYLKELRDFTDKTAHIVAENCVSKTRFESFIASCVFMLSALIAFYCRDFITSALCLGLGCIIIGFSLLTDYRVARGYFGANGDEALELIKYIARQTNKTGKPPGSQVSQPYDSRELVSEPAISLGDAGQRI